MKKLLLLLGASAFLLTACDDNAPRAQSVDQKDREQQEQILKEAQREVGLPNITNFAEKRTLKLVEELADKRTPTYSYVYSQMKGCFVYLGPTYGYPIPYATQYTNPDKYTAYYYGQSGVSSVVVPQADPNGLFKPADANGTWILMRDPKADQLLPQYIEDNVSTFTFRIKERECQ